MVQSAEIYLFAADSQPTLARTVIVKRKDGRLVTTFPVNDRTTVPGDVSVPRYSTIGDERQGNPYRWGVQTAIPFTNETFLSDDHVGLTRNPHFSNNMLHILLERPPRRR